MLIPAVLAPVIAGVVALLGTYLVYRLTPRASPTSTHDAGFRYGQIVSASLVSLAHGTNDAQKTMGIITLALIATATIGADAGLPIWVIVSARARHRARHLPRRLARHPHDGQGPHRIKPPQGFAAETSSAAVILASSHFGFPLSTTHVAIGLHHRRRASASRLAEVRWSVAGRMALGWLITLPAAGLVGGATAWASAAIGGTPGVLAMAAVAALIAASLYYATRSDRVTPENVIEPASPSLADPVVADPGALVAA